MIKQSATLNFNNKQFNIYGDQGDSSVFTMLSRDGVYEPWIAKLFQSIILEDFFCFDIGANIGVLSVEMSQLATKGQVFSFEPFTKSFTYLCQNIKRK